MSGFGAHRFDILEAERELSAFRFLLQGMDRLKEREHILTAFKGWPNLCAMFGQFHGQIRTADRIRREFAVGPFRADLAVRLEGTRNFLFVEFEGARPGCIFRHSGRTIPEWSRDFEKGFSQIVDWAWAHDVHRTTPPFLNLFGERPNCVGVLVIGRDGELADPVSRDRWGWRSRKVQADGWIVTLLTYDDLLLHFDTDLKAKLEQASQIGRQI